MSYISDCYDIFAMEARPIHSEIIAFIIEGYLFS